MRSEISVFFSYGDVTGTVRQSTATHEPILGLHVIWRQQSPEREAKEQSPWG